MEEYIRFTAELSSWGADMGLRNMTDDELRALLEEECNIPADCIEDVEVSA